MIREKIVTKRLNSWGQFYNLFRCLYVAFVRFFHPSYH